MKFPDSHGPIPGARGLNPQKERWCSSCWPEQNKRAQRDRDSYHTLGVWGEDTALDSCSVTPQILQHLTALRHQTTHTNMTGQSSTPVTTCYILSRLLFRFKPRLVKWKTLNWKYSISSKCLPRSYFCVMDMNDSLGFWNLHGVTRAVKMCWMLIKYA